MKARPLYWSVRRELWEHKSVWMAPLVVAVLATAAILIHVVKGNDILAKLATMEPTKQAALIVVPFSVIASVILLTGFVVGAFYCLDAMNAERRDRSILFWKSMPVSDLTAVTAKAIVALAIQPTVVFVLALLAQAILLFTSVVLWMTQGLDTAMLWNAVKLHKMTALMLYGVIVHILWFAPLYAYFLVVSAWARRAVFLWAMLPPVMIAVVEALAFSTSHFASLIQYRVTGAMQEAWVVDVSRRKASDMSQIDPIGFLTAPGLALGLLFAVVCFVVAVRLRRDRDFG